MKSNIDAKLSKYLLPCIREIDEILGNQSKEAAEAILRLQKDLTTKEQEEERLVAITISHKTQIMEMMLTLAVQAANEYSLDNTETRQLIHEEIQEILLSDLLDRKS